MYNNGNSSKNVTGSSVVDGSLASADYPDNGLSGDKIDGGIISNFRSTGIDDRSSTVKNLTITDTNVDVAGSITCDSTMTVASGSTSVSVQSDGINMTRASAPVYLNVPGASSDFVIRNGSGYTERMRIDSSGKVLVGMTDISGTGVYLMKNNGNSGYMSFNQTGGNGITTISFKYSGSQIGQIYTNTSSTVYATSSDYRLKEDEQPMVGSVDRLKALNPINFAWKLDGARTDGFLAHEAGEVVPEAITGTKDAMTAMGNITDAEGEIIEENVEEPIELQEGQVWTKTGEVEDYQGIDQSKLVPLLVSALQEAIARIETLENA